MQLEFFPQGIATFFPFSVSFHKISKSWTIDSGDNLSFVFSDKENLSIFAQHMNCAGANLALPRKCTIASDQYIL